MKYLARFILGIVLVIVLAACSSTEKDEGDSASEQGEKETPLSEETDATKEIDETTPPEEPEAITREISISAIGDILIHGSVYRDAQTANGYDFMPMFERVMPYLGEATITLANQETMIGGSALGLSTYPRFNSPFEVGDTLKEVGVDVVTIANNHTLDRGEEAIKNAIHHWETIDMMYTGAYKDEVDRSKIRVLHTNEDINVAFLSYTYGTNGLPVPEGKPYLVNLIDKERMASDIEKAKSLADVVVLSLHFGSEYQRVPNEEQKELVQFAADQGVHAVIGHHPHVLQPLEWIKGKNGNKTFVAYSLGNFLSAQDKFYRQIGGMVRFKIKQVTKGEEETVTIESPEFLPTYVKYQDWSNYRIIPMYLLTNEELPNAKQHYQEIKDHLSQWMPELEFIERK